MCFVDFIQSFVDTLLRGYTSLAQNAKGYDVYFVVSF